MATFVSLVLYPLSPSLHWLAPQAKLRLARSHYLTWQRNKRESRRTNIQVGSSSSRHLQPPLLSLLFVIRRGRLGYDTSTHTHTHTKFNELPQALGVLRPGKLCSLMPNTSPLARRRHCTYVLSSCLTNLFLSKR